MILGRRFSSGPLQTKRSTRNGDAVKKLAIRILMMIMIITCSAAGAAAGDTKKIYDKDWRVKGYIRDDGHGTKKIYDRNWNTEGYIRDDTIYDRNGNRTGRIGK